MPSTPPVFAIACLTASTSLRTARRTTASRRAPWIYSRSAALIRRLVVATARVIDDVLKMLDNVVVEANIVIRVFPGAMGTTGPRLALLKSYSFFICEVFVS